MGFVDDYDGGLCNSKIFHLYSDGEWIGILRFGRGKKWTIEKSWINSFTRDVNITSVSIEDAESNEST